MRKKASVTGFLRASPLPEEAHFKPRLNGLHALSKKPRKPSPNAGGDTSGQREAVHSVLPTLPSRFML
jgi:hypothetical protein